jgi:hypothetical protein
LQLLGGAARPRAPRTEEEAPSVRRGWIKLLPGPECQPPCREISAGSLRTTPAGKHPPSLKAPHISRPIPRKEEGPAGRPARDGPPPPGRELHSCVRARATARGIARQLSHSQTMPCHTPLRPSKRRARGLRPSDKGNQTEAAPSDSASGIGILETTPARGACPATQQPQALPSWSRKAPHPPHTRQTPAHGMHTPPAFRWRRAPRCGVCLFLARRRTKSRQLISSSLRWVLAFS